MLVFKTTRLPKVLASKIFRANNNEIVKSINSNKAAKMVVDLFKAKKSKNEKSKNLTYIKAPKNLFS